MPSMVNITIKKADATTDILWSSVSPSAGSGVPAIWKSLAVGNADSHRPEMRLQIANSKDGKSTKGRLTFVYPSLSTDTTTGLTSVVRNARIFIDLDLPREMPDAEVAEAIYQCTGLISGALIRTSLKDRSAPT